MRKFPSEINSFLIMKNPFCIIKYFSEKEENGPLDNFNYNLQVKTIRKESLYQIFFKIISLALSCFYVIVYIECKLNLMKA